MGPFLKTFNGQHIKGTGSSSQTATYIYNIMQNRTTGVMLVGIILSGNNSIFINEILNYV